MVRALWRLLITNLLGNLLLALLYLPRALRARRRPRWVKVVVKEPLPSRPPRAGRWLFRRETPSLASLDQLFGELGRDRSLAGVIVKLESVPGGWARMQSLRAALVRLRAAQKRVVVHLSAPGLREYYVATAGDAIVMDESGPLSLTGLALEATFFGGALEKVGARAEAEYRGAYKSFAETFTRKDMSPAHREALEAILDRLDAEVREAIAAARGVDPLLDAGPLYTGGPYMAPDAERLGLVDAIRYEDELPEWLGQPAPRVATPAEWRSMRARGFRWKPLFGGPRRVQVVSLHGTIVPGEGTDFPRRSLGADAAARALTAARKSRRVAAVVLHVDSRGGSASASDLIWREVVRLGREKPVVAYFEDFAASGGYYLSCAATKIVAQPATLTGSIGVVAGKLNLSGLLERVGLNTVTVARGEAAGMFSASRGFSEEERRRLAAEVDALYRQFVTKVAQGRKLDAAAAEAAAQGRVWLGVDARDRGLVDELGDVETAIDRARELGRRRPGERLQVEDVHVSPRRRGLLVRLFGDAGPAPELPAVVADFAELALLARERALLLPPWTLEI